MPHPSTPEPTSLRASAPRASGGSDVVVIGEALIDVVERGGTRVEHPGGSPANVALGLGRMGVRTALLTCLGRDERGDAIVDRLAGSGVRVLGDSFSVDRTSTAAATVDADGQASYVFDVMWSLPAEPLPSTPRILHTGSIAAFLEPGATEVNRHLAEAGADEVTFDPNIRPALLGERVEALDAFRRTAGLATVVKLSDEDAEWLFPGASVEEVLDTIIALGPRLAAITLGGEGAMLATSADHVRIPAMRVDVVDTIGAGDTFMASLIASVAQEGSAPLDRAALERWGTAAARAAAITVSRAGADLPWSTELAS